MHKLGKIDEECLKIWPESANVKWSWWRFIWLKKDFKAGVSRDDKPKIDIWAYRYVPWCGRLWWCEKWLGTHDTLFPFNKAIVALIACLTILFVAVCSLVGFVQIIRWIILL